MNTTTVIALEVQRLVKGLTLAFGATTLVLLVVVTVAALRELPDMEGGLAIAFMCLAIGVYGFAGLFLWGYSPYFLRPGIIRLAQDVTVHHPAVLKEPLVIPEASIVHAFIDWFPQDSKGHTRLFREKFEPLFRNEYAAVLAEAPRGPYDTPNLVLQLDEPIVVPTRRLLSRDTGSYRHVLLRVENPQAAAIALQRSGLTVVNVWGNPLEVEGMEM